MLEFNGNKRFTIIGFTILLVLWNPMIIAGSMPASYDSNDTIVLTELNFEEELEKKALMVMFYTPE